MRIIKKEQKTNEQSLETQISINESNQDMFSEVLETKVESESHTLNENDIQVQFMFNDSTQINELNYTTNRQIEIPSN